MTLQDKQHLLAEVSNKDVQTQWLLRTQQHILLSGLCPAGVGEV